MRLRGIRESMLGVGLVVALAGPAAAVPRTLEPAGVFSVPNFYLNGAVQVLTSADGAHAYVVSSVDDAISVFSRDAGTGYLTFVEAERQGVGGVDGLDGASAVAISPDGAHVYVASNETEALAIFGRNAGSGALTYVAAVHNGLPVGFGLQQPFALAVSPDGAHVYVAGLNSVAAFSRNAGTGLLTFVEVEFDGVGGVDGIDRALSLAISPDGAHVYVTGAFDDAVAVFARNAGTGALTFVEVQREGVGGVTGITLAGTIVVSLDGSHVYVGGFDVAVFERDAGTGALTFVEVVTAGITQPLSLAISPDGTNVYLWQHSGSVSAVVTFDRDALTGALAFVDLEGAIGNVFVTPDGAHLLFAYNGIHVYERDAGTGVPTLLTNVGTIGSLDTIDVASDGGHVYATDGVRVVIFGRDDVTGILSYLGVHPRDAGPLVLSPDGANVYTNESSRIGVYARNAVSGALTLVDVEASPVSLAFTRLTLSPDGANLYAPVADDDQVAVFSRDAGTGALTFIEVEQSGGFVSRNVVVSPDGAHVYGGGSSVVIFDRDAGTGALTFVGTADHAGSVRISPDGLYVYVHAFNLFDAFDQSGLTVLARNAGTGALTFVETEREDEAGVGEIPGAVAVSPDGELLIGTFGGTTSLFASQASGKIVFVESTQGFTGFDGAFSADGEHLYRAGYGSSTGFGAVQLLTRGFAGCDSGPLPGCRLPRGGALRISASRGIVWRWTRGDETLPAALGDPTDSTDYALCVYDESGPSTLVMRALVPAAGDCVSGSPTCWTTTGTGFRYRDPHRTPAGVFDLKLKSGTDDKARITMRGSDEDLILPTFPLGLPVRVQLESSTGECWEATYSVPRANDGTHFVASPD
jgi:6-phosphogluconolactonase (cycloisomerase 2 family)